MSVLFIVLQYVTFIDGYYNFVHLLTCDAAIVFDSVETVLQYRIWWYSPETVQLTLLRNTTHVVAIAMKMARYVSGTCPQHICSICTHCLRHTYLARKLYRHLRWPVTLTPTMNGHHLEGCVLLSSLLLNILSPLIDFWKFYLVTGIMETLSI